MYKPYQIDMLEFRLVSTKRPYHAFMRLVELFEGECLSKTGCKVERKDESTVRIFREGEREIDISITFVQYGKNDIFEDLNAEAEHPSSSTSEDSAEQRQPTYAKFASRKLNPLKLYNFVDKIRAIALSEIDVFE